jgi:hypothetical protein
VDEQNPSSTEQPQQPAGASVEAPDEPAAGFRARGRVRRRARFLRKARELAYRDLGGLLFNLHRFGQRNDALVLAKLGTLTQIDSELRSIEAALDSRRPITVLREAGVTACPRCAAIHSGEDRFCPGCGLPLSRRVDLPISAAVSAPQPAAAAPPAPPAAPQPAAAGAPAPPPEQQPATPPATPAAAPAGGPQPPPAPASPPAAAAGASSASDRPPAAGAHTTHAPVPAAPAAPNRPLGSPSPESPAPPTSDGEEQPTQVFSSRAPSP